MDCSPPGWEDPWAGKICQRSDSLATPVSLGFPGWLRIRLQCGRPGFEPWVGKIPWRMERLPTPVLCPGEVHGVAKSWIRLSNFHFHNVPLVYQNPFSPLKPIHILSLSLKANTITSACNAIFSTIFSFKVAIGNFNYLDN